MPMLVRFVLLVSLMLGAVFGATIINQQWAAYFTIPSLSAVVVVFGLFPIMWAEHVYGQQR